MSRLTRRLTAMLRGALALSLACALLACQDKGEAASITDAMPSASESQKQAIREMERKMKEQGAPTFNGVRLYTGPHRTPKTMEGLTIVGYNYTDTYISDFAVDGAGGGNISVSSLDHTYGGGTCCASVPADTPLPTTVEITWKRDGDVPRCAQTVLLDGPVPAAARYFEVHFFQNGKIEVALTENPSAPRVLMDRFDYAHRKASGNVNNDKLFSKCGHVQKN